MEEVNTVRNFIICTRPLISLGRSVTKNEVGGPYGTHGRGDKSVQGFGGKPPKERDHSEDRSVDGIRMDFRGIG
jgi:hypothetical protein